MKLNTLYNMCKINCGELCKHPPAYCAGYNAGLAIIKRFQCNYTAFLHQGNIITLLLIKAQKLHKFALIEGALYLRPISLHCEFCGLVRLDVFNAVFIANLFKCVPASAPSCSFIICKVILFVFGAIHKTHSLDTTKVFIYRA